METIYSYRTTLPQYNNITKARLFTLEGQAAYILAKKLFGNNIDNHISIVINNCGFHWSDNKLYCDVDRLLAGDCNKTIKCLDIVWTKPTE